ncbi:helix-turn-helix domain-containing protein [Cylindrospermopsis curvispora]|uniref:Helix-turn-helix domain-containing protein n=1 Tax=Cylindrospermopsis curvispora GIHE-G1 TaxID=2666332 RepID=A0A7H0F5S3_9CYAN|nr:helix-turn-helix domain-containing protein [Cylindrospermopsis curvispora]QNP31389.1 helix-turn-helix domain-containing protein [Cylindrospermopsis curvispora GIHE-G1]
MPEETKAKTLKSPYKKDKESLQNYIRQLLEAGLNNCQIGKLVGKHSSTIGDYRDRMGLTQNKFDHTTREKVRELYNSGMAKAAIARELGISRQRVSELVRDYIAAQINERSNNLSI